jgi:dihydroorotase
MKIRKPDNFHTHLRDHEDLTTLAIMQTLPGYARVMFMPNLKEPLVTAPQVVAYLERLHRWSTGPLQFFPTLMLTNETTVNDIREAKKVGVIAVKYYPGDIYVHLCSGLNDPLSSNLITIFKECRKQEISVSVHAEAANTYFLYAEDSFLPYIREWHRQVPGLRIVVEHISSAKTVEFVESCGPEVKATITPMHLVSTTDDIIYGRPGETRGYHVHNAYYPPPKTPEDRLALIQAATSGSPKYFGGDDNAPHTKSNKETTCSCAGSYPALCSVETYAEVFESYGSLHRLEDFLSRFGAEHYHLPLNQLTIELVQKPWLMPNAVAFSTNSPPNSPDDQRIVPWRAGEIIPWKIRHAR